MPRTERLVEARYDGTCAVCGRNFSAGTWIYWSPGNRTEHVGHRTGPIVRPGNQAQARTRNRALRALM